MLSPPPLAMHRVPQKLGIPTSSGSCRGLFRPPLTQQQDTLLGRMRANVAEQPLRCCFLVSSCCRTASNVLLSPASRMHRAFSAGWSITRLKGASITRLKGAWNLDVHWRSSPEVRSNFARVGLMASL